ncbi:hypothetical protein [Kitasatospora phosalacinea]|uniref:Uncharacterized protein n=1 Tax=Kitasatospora phosalacinea TaxID=2065 RepID=A0A9W6PPU3_9ACTN|nr:hypothetical protein [Kitasatospora phosalacinea]GLW58713.1 hypothetical protein Kpho01_67240 [Kitasatospora phosalacinea]
MSTAVLADQDIVSDFMTVLVAHRHLQAAAQLGGGRWRVRRTGTGQGEVLTADQVEELVMDHVISAFAARGLADADADF